MDTHDSVSPSLAVAVIVACAALWLLAALGHLA